MASFSGEGGTLPSSVRGALHDAVLADIAHGRSAPTRGQRYAAACIADGGLTTGNRALAQIGTSGSHKSNARRDLWVHTRREYAFLQRISAYTVSCGFSTKNGGQRLRPVSMMLPHEMFSALFELDMFYDAFGSDEDREAYWTSLAEPWWTPEHPAYARVMACPSKAVPLRTHGDDVACRKGLVHLSMLVFTFASVLATRSTIDDVMLVFGLLQEHLLDDTVDQVFHAAVWSLDVLATGFWPSTDHLHAPLTGLRAQRRGPLAAGYFGICTQHLGDWKYIKEVCHLGRHYGSFMCCTYCDCRKLPGPGNFADFSSAGVAWFEEHATPSDAFMASLPAAGPPFLPRTYGFDLRMLLVDFMHSDLLGVGGWLLANAMLDLATTGRFGTFAGPRKEKMEQALLSAYNLFVRFTKDHNITHSQKQFKLSILGAGTSTAWPEFKGKAHNCSVVLRWMSAFVTANPGPDRHGKLVDVCLMAHGRYHQVMRDAGRQFTASQAREFHDAGLLMLRSYSLLSRSAHLRRQARWQMKPKHHHLWHAFRQVLDSCTNPRSHWLFKHEDFMGLAAAIGVHIHPSSLSRELLATWSLHWAMAVPEHVNRKALKRKRFPTFARCGRRLRKKENHDLPSRGVDVHNGLTAP